jgi:hypothetical protein
MNQQLIEQYVAGKMSEADAEAFEIFCLENPEFARQVEIEQRLKAGIAQVARGSTAEFVRSGNESRWKIALAASILLFVCAGAFLWQRSAAVHPNILAAIAGDADRGGPSMRLALVRGAENAAKLPRGVVRVEIVGLFDPDHRYGVVLDRLTGQRAETVAAIYGQRPSSPVTLEVLLDGDQLSSGSYALHVINDSRNEPLEFVFVKP